MCFMLPCLAYFPRLFSVLYRNTGTGVWQAFQGLVGGGWIGLEWIGLDQSGLPGISFRSLLSFYLFSFCLLSLVAPVLFWDVHDLDSRSLHAYFFLSFLFEERSSIIIIPVRNSRIYTYTIPYFYFLLLLLLLLRVKLL